ncbi:hypothetical protein TSUD_351920 [Trifolium subterraneum]|nr:hypothetical protein TSUD_351920 [Trifolium subterraneum]
MKEILKIAYVWLLKLLTFFTTNPLELFCQFPLMVVNLMASLTAQEEYGKVPSHSFYADDLMIFCKGKLSGIKALKDLFNLYALESGQVINNSKSTIFYGSITQGSIFIYFWPVALLKDIEKSVGNFIWGEDIDKRKLVTTSWKKICRPFSQGGLNLRSLSKLNKATNLKLCWNLINSHCSWAKLLKDRVVRGKRIIQHLISSSIWSSIRDEFEVIMANSIWLIGNGEEVNFCNDNWCGIPLSEHFNIPPHISHLLSSKAKVIWTPDIPPSKSLFAWRLMHGKVPTDENLMIRGCCIPSMCNLCNSHEESSFHLFFECAYAIRLWSWLIGCLNMVLHFTMDDMWKLCDLNWSPQCKVTVTATIINLINTIWFVRNQARYNNKITSWRSTISMIIANTSLTGNNTSKPSSNSIRDFTFLKMFRICIHHPKVPIVKEIFWQPPLVNWFKCNIDGASCGNPGNASCGGILRDSNANFIYAFSEPLGVNSSYYAELCGAMQAIEIAFQKGWSNIWLETNSTLVVTAFKNPAKPVAWPFRNRWENVLVMARSLNFIVSHICREGNEVADLLANHGLSLGSLTCWSDSPLFISECLKKNKLGMPSFRLCSS